MPKKEALTPSSLLSSSVEDSTFLVSHPLNAPESRSVRFVVRCDGAASVITYQLPEALQGKDVRPDLSVLCSLPTMLVADYCAAMGVFDTLDLKPITDDVLSGKLLVVKHADPWSIMVASTQRSAWKLLLKSLGGKYAALATQDNRKTGQMQPHPLHDLFM